MKLIVNERPTGLTLAFTKAGHVTQTTNSECIALAKQLESLPSVAGYIPATKGPGRAPISDAARVHLLVYATRGDETQRTFSDQPSVGVLNLQSTKLVEALTACIDTLGA